MENTPETFADIPDEFDTAEIDHAVAQHELALEIDYHVQQNQLENKKHQCN